MSNRPWMVLFLLSLTAFGCARQVVRAPDHGVVAIPANTNVWPLRFRDKADRIMQQHFPDGYVVDLEEETVVGKTTTVGDDCGWFSASTTTDEREWRIHYHRQ